MHPIALLLALPLLQDPELPDDPPPFDEEVVSIPRPPADDTLVVTPSLAPEERLKSPFTVQVVGEGLLRERAYRTTPQALRDVPGVLVQETAHGQGSPFIRGFTAQNNLFLINGIRLNNSAFRPGPNQYWATVDPYSVERFEVLKGPASVQYGSDAVGGTVQAFTRSPYAWDAENGVAGAVEWRAATGENYQIGRAEVSGAAGDVGVVLGATYKDFGDLEGGKDVGTQDGTGYDEFDTDARVEWWLGEDTRLDFGWYRVRQNAVPRTHRTVNGLSWEGLSVGSDLRRNLDQDRDLYYAQLHMDDLGGGIDRAVFSLSFHEQAEVRDRIRSNGNQEFQGFDVGTVGLFAHLFSDTSVGNLAYGFEYYRDSVDSFLDRGANQTAADNIQGSVADDATYDSLSLFVQDEIALSETTELTVGARYQRSAADAKSVRDPVSDTRISLEDDWDAVVGTARLAHAVSEEWNVFGGISQGFRAPNLSDLTRFDSARSNEFEIPAPDLDPEFFTSFELGTRTTSERLTAEAAVFYTAIEDMIVRFPTGNTNGAGEFEVTKDNVGDGYIWGLELGGAYALDAAWELFGNLAWQEGKADTFVDSTSNATRENLSRIQPLTYRAGLRWNASDRRQWAELLVTRAEDADKLSPRDEGDDSRIPPGGTPAYTTLDLRGGWKVRDDLTVTAGLENITDEDYRVHGSGLNRVGRNLVVGLRWTF